MILTRTEGIKRIRKEIDQKVDCMAVAYLKVMFKKSKVKLSKKDFRILKNALKDDLRNNMTIQVRPMGWNEPTMQLGCR